MEPGSELETDKAKKIPTFDLIFKIYQWLEIVAAFLITGLIISMIFYYSNPGQSRFSISVAIAIAGFVLGIFVASRQWDKGEGHISKK